MILIDQEELLLDTNIVTYISSHTSWKNEYLPILFGKSLCIGFMTVAELLESAYHRQVNIKNIQRLKEELSIDYKILPFSEEICDIFAQIRYERRNRPISVPDALIAATALAYKLPLVTHNKKDFDNISGLEIITKYVVSFI
ncbi:MAG: PIN domain-containing protein [Planctomycetaceae bacterium]|jgi:predicted nucleic acid-binding protein|nr:PIN domain-containing protein [Planctomycetaceae bacterium]